MLGFCELAVMDRRGMVPYGLTLVVWLSGGIDGGEPRKEQDCPKQSLSGLPGDEPSLNRRLPHHAWQQGWEIRAGPNARILVYMDDRSRASRSAIEGVVADKSEGCERREGRKDREMERMVKAMLLSSRRPNART